MCITVGRITNLYCSSTSTIRNKKLLLSGRAGFQLFAAPPPMHSNSEHQFQVRLAASSGSFRQRGKYFDDSFQKISYTLQNGGLKCLGKTQRAGMGSFKRAPTAHDEHSVPIGSSPADRRWHLTGQARNASSKRDVHTSPIIVRQL